MGSFPVPDELCDLVLEHSGHVCPPTDLDAVCDLWPDLSVIEENLDKEGYLIPMGVSGAEVLLRKQDPPSRKKFTLAHELGHWILALYDGEHISFGKIERHNLSLSSHQVRKSPIETWCNKFAASLLMPKMDIFRHIHGTPGPELLRRVVAGPSVFGVSEEAFHNRLAETTHVSLGQVIVAGAAPVVRRIFVSAYELRDEIVEVINKLSMYYSPTKGLPDGPTRINAYLAYTKMTRSSRYSHSWLVCVLPKNGLVVS